MFLFSDLFSSRKLKASKRPRRLQCETLERRAMLSADAMNNAPLHNPVVVEALPSRPAGAELGTAASDNAGQVSAPVGGNADFATNGPDAATSTGATVANPYLGNNPWMDDVQTLGTNTSASGAGNGTVSDPLYQPYFTGLQEYAQYEEAIESLAAQQAAQQMASRLS